MTCLPNQRFRFSFRGALVTVGVVLLLLSLSHDLHADGCVNCDDKPDLVIQHSPGCVHCIRFVQDFKGNAKFRKWLESNFDIGWQLVQDYPQPRFLIDGRLIVSGYRNMQWLGNLLSKHLPAEDEPQPTQVMPGPNQNSHPTDRFVTHPELDKRVGTLSKTIQAVRERTSRRDDEHEDAFREIEKWGKHSVEPLADRVETLEQRQEKTGEGVFGARVSLSTVKSEVETLQGEQQQLSSGLKDLIEELKATRQQQASTIETSSHVTPSTKSSADESEPLTKRLWGLIKHGVWPTLTVLEWLGIFSVSAVGTASTGGVAGVGFLIARWLFSKMTEERAPGGRSSDHDFQR